ncbi:acid phosphatase [Aurantiacibacter xanthus]|uniref:5'-nucleotidase n=1 Tax=Aurantiacibacter xanthus TaxID=1784712 RepID=A0A3A1PGW1_9SPHN|nr:5'/3'-nucleotidase SurE [Aurantiacibacter xanthus]RIV92882.1 acid phosphatase [Aurantiacibacter xanthus]
MRLASLLAAAALVAAPAAAEARTIVVSNDDGLTSNVVALYHALKEAGHDVIVSVPCRNQSGQGAALRIGTPLTPLAEPCLNDAAKAGDPAAGPMARADLPAGDFFYVDGTPIMALLYGLDVAGKARWGGAPDLVLSGPNEGQNVGSIAISSGTVSNAQFAALRGLPAIALSAGSNTEDGDLANPISPEVAQLSVELIAALEEKAGDGPLLPQGIALNVNFPDQPAGAAWRATRMGTYNTYAIGFVANMAEDASPTMRAMAEAHGAQLPALPGLSFAITADAPAPGQENDEAYVYRTAIAVSPMQAGYAGSAAAEAVVAWQIDDLTAD